MHNEEDEGTYYEEDENEIEDIIEEQYNIELASTTRTLKKTNTKTTYTTNTTNKTNTQGCRTQRNRTNANIHHHLSNIGEQNSRRGTNEYEEEQW